MRSPRPGSGLEMDVLKRTGSTAKHDAQGKPRRLPYAVSGYLLAALLTLFPAGCVGSTGTNPSPSGALSVGRTEIASPIVTPTPTAAPSFVATGSMNVARMDFTATLLLDGTVLVAGGSLGEGAAQTYLASAEIYNPATGKFTATGSMKTARAGQTATRLKDGRVLIAGGGGCANGNTCGGSDTQLLASAELYDPATGAFTRTGSMSAGRDRATATLLADGRVVVAYGGNTGHATAELYDPASGKFTRTGIVLDFNNDATATRLADGKVLFIGSLVDGPAAEVYDPETGSSTTIPYALSLDAAPSALYNGQSFTRTAAQTATLLNDGHVLLFAGGYLETFDPSAQRFTPAGFLSPPGQWNDPTATLLADGRVLFEGGWTPGAGDNMSPAVSSASTYEPNKSSHQVGSMTTARLYETATLLFDGSVLIAGGTADQENALASAELFKP
jgi:hypothetical protein